MENIFEILFLSHLLTGGYINDITYLLNPKENKSLESKSYQRKTSNLFVLTLLLCPTYGIHNLYYTMLHRGHPNTNSNTDHGGCTRYNII